MNNYYPYQEVYPRCKYGWDVKAPDGNPDCKIKASIKKGAEIFCSNCYMKLFTKIGEKSEIR